MAINFSTIYPGTTNVVSDNSGIKFPVATIRKLNSVSFQSVIIDEIQSVVSIQTRTR